MRRREFISYLLAIAFLVGIHSASGRAVTPGRSLKARLLPDQAPSGHGKIPGPEQTAFLFNQRRLAVPGRINDLIVAKINKDAFSDIAILDYENYKIRILLGDKTLEFKKKFEKTFQELHDLFAGAADFTGDGNLDLAVENSSRTIHFSIFPGDGMGGLKKALNIGTGGSSIIWFNYASPINLNGDGIPDLIGLGFLGEVALCRNLGKGRFTVQEFDDDAGNDGLVAGDFTGDGVDDFLLAEVTQEKVYFFKNNGVGTFAPPRGIPVKDLGYGLYAADVNADGKLDLLGAGHDEGQAWTMLGRGNGTFRNKKILPGDGTLRYGACLADFNGDKKLDVVAPEEHGMYFYAGLGNGTFAAPVVLADALRFNYSGASNAGFGYFNQDAKPDIVGAQYFDSSMSPQSNLVVFVNGKAPASLQISNLQILYSHYNGTNIYLRGSVDFSGSGVDLHYDPAGDDPTDSAFLQFRVDVSGANFPTFSATYAASGEFIHKPGASSGTIAFDLTLTSPKIIYPAYSPTVTLDYIYVMDYNLVQSNVIE